MLLTDHFLLVFDWAENHFLHFATVILFKQCSWPSFGSCEAWFPLCESRMYSMVLNEQIRADIYLFVSSQYNTEQTHIKMEEEKREDPQQPIQKNKNEQSELNVLFVFISYLKGCRGICRLLNWVITQCTESFYCKWRGFPPSLPHILGIPRKFSKLRSLWKKATQIFCFI